MYNLITVSKLVKDYRTKSEHLHILKGINFKLDYNESIAITGESGSGKSTFLNMIGGLDNVTSGNIFIDNVDITTLNEKEITFFRNKKIGFIFQSHYLIEEFNSLENVMIPFLINNFNKKLARKKAEKLLEYMGMQERMKSYPSQLSGGEKQRVAIARAYINDPSLILADEPTGNLDEANAAKVLNLLFNISKMEKHALIIVSHSTQIVNMADSCFHLEGGYLIKK